MSTSFVSRGDFVDPQRMTFIARSATTHSPKLKSFGFTHQSERSPPKPGVSDKNEESLFDETMQRASTHSRRRSLGKGKMSVESGYSESSVVFDDPFVRSPVNGPASENLAPRPLTSDGSHLKRSRGSILVKASDALNLRFGRKPKSIRQPHPAPIILPGVIEISAPRHDEEVEERERLRDAAAQSIGLGPDILQESQPRNDSIDEMDEDAEEGLGGEFEMVQPPPPTSRSARSSSVSSMPLPRPPSSNRQRAGSLQHSLIHMRTRSTTPASFIQSFPATPASLKPSTIMTATFHKYHPPTSLRIFALSKQWKYRFLVLSSPTHTSSRGQVPAVSHLHLFKSSTSEERELERLEINEDSIIFVADEEVGGRKGVVMVGGMDVGRKEMKQEIGGQTMWQLQIPDATVAQKWIAAIKSAILSQRSMRAGLGVLAQTLEGNEPSGDMDVMLTMRAQGIISSPIPRRATLPEFSGLRSQMTQPVVVPETLSRSSPLSVRSQAGTHRSVSAFRGLFTGSTRPRSPSRSSSANPELGNTEDSFGAVGNNLLNMHQTNDVPISPSSLPFHSRSPVIPTVATPRISVPSPIISSADQLVTDHSNIDWSTAVDTNSNRRDPGMPEGSLSPLQPPPHRKTWVSHGPKPSNDDTIMYTHNHGNGSIAGNFGLGTLPPEGRATSPPASPAPTGTSLGSPEQRGHTGSTTSVSTVASVELGGPKRWSRQGILSQRLTPPSGPPPIVPEVQPAPDVSPISKMQTPHPYLRERASSSRSSTVNSPLSAVSVPPNASKRESNSSYSSSATSTHSRFSVPHRNSSQRRSVQPPPPRPAPNFAPPPTPEQASPPPSPVTARPTKSSFRDSVAQRALRLSLSSPKPPPSSSLPPRPDEKVFRSHRRTTSSSSQSSTINTQPTPTSSPITAGPPHPPPTGPLPPPPFSPVSRHASIKQRLRILSAPSSAPSIQTFTSSTHVTMHSFTPTSSTDPYCSQPSTPIAEPITMDPNFLYFSPPEPEPRPQSPDRLLAPEPFPNSPEITSLSPPPRRGSRQITGVEREKLNVESSQGQIDDSREQPTVRTDKRTSLSSSVVSLAAA